MVTMVINTVTIVTTNEKREYNMDDAFKWGFGEAVRRRRAEANISQTTFALIVNLSRLTLRRIEQGEANPTMDVMLSVARGLDMPLSALVNEGERLAKEYRKR